MAMVNEFLEKIKGKKIVLVLKMDEYTNRTHDGCDRRLDAQKIAGTLEGTFNDGWILVDGSLYNLRFIMEIYEDS